MPLHPRRGEPVVSMQQAWGYGVGPALRRCCERDVPLYNPCTTLVHPLSIPCTCYACASSFSLCGPCSEHSNLPPSKGLQFNPAWPPDTAIRLWHCERRAARQPERGESSQRRSTPWPAPAVGIPLAPPAPPTVRLSRKGRPTCRRPGSASQTRGPCASTSIGR